MDSESASSMNPATDIPHILSQVQGSILSHGDTQEIDAFCKALSISLGGVRDGKDTQAIIQKICDSEEIADGNSDRLDTSKMEDANLTSSEGFTKSAKKKNTQKKKKTVGRDGVMIVKIPETTYIMLGVRPELVPKCHVISGQFRIPIYQEDDFERVDAIIAGYMKRAVRSKNPTANTDSPCSQKSNDY